MKYIVMPVFWAVFAIVWLLVGRPLFALCIGAEDFWNWDFSNVVEFWTGPFFEYGANSRFEEHLWVVDTYRYYTFWDLFLSNVEITKERKW